MEKPLRKEYRGEIIEDLDNKVVYKLGLKKKKNKLSRKDKKK